MMPSSPQTCDQALNLERQEGWILPLYVLHCNQRILYPCTVSTRIVLPSCILSSSGICHTAPASFQVPCICNTCSALSAKDSFPSLGGHDPREPRTRSTQSQHNLRPQPQMGMQAEQRPRLQEQAGLL